MTEVLFAGIYGDYCMDGTESRKVADQQPSLENRD